MTELKNTRTGRDIPASLLPEVQHDIEKINRRAAKMGLAGFTLTVSAPWLAPHPKRALADDGVKIEMVAINVVGEPVTMPGGWTLEGKVDFEDGLTIVNGRPGGQEIPTRFRTATRACDHCGFDRQRQSVVLFANPDGRWIQIGRNCVKDYFATSPEQALWAAGAYASLFAGLDERMGGMGSSGPLYIDIDRTLAVTLRVVAEHGYMSKSRADEINMNTERSVTPTSANVHTYMWGVGKYADKFRSEVGAVTEQDLAKAREILAWARGHFHESDASDYAHNLALLLARDSVQDRRLGLIVSVVGAYKRAMERAAERAERVNAHVGTIGQRREFVTTYLGESSFETQFGVMYVGRFDSTEGLLVYKGTSPFWSSDVKSGDPVRFVGTIKSHDDYKGTLQTVVSRCILNGKAPKAKRADLVAA